MVRVVLDTNVYLSAILFGGLPEVILALARAAAIQLVASDAILDEVSAVLVRKFHWTRGQALTVRRELRSISGLVGPQQRLRVITADEPNRVLECAVAGGADVIVSGDRRHLLRLEGLRGIPIVTPRRFSENYLRESP